MPKILWLVIGFTFGIENSLALPQRVNLSLELGTLVWFSFSFIPKLALETLDFKLSFRFPPPQVIGLNVVVKGGEGWISISKP